MGALSVEIKENIMVSLGKARRVARRHWIVTLLALTFLLAGAVGTVLFAVQPGAAFQGTTAAGAHEWWQAFKADDAFCSNCHVAQGEELIAGPHKSVANSSCTSCHKPAAGEHVASVAKCVDCHGNQSVALANDAHAGIVATLGETVGTESQTCQSCHTKVPIDITATQQDPLPLTMTP